MSDTELKPCPRCGSANIKALVSEICCPVQYSATAHCSDCGLEDVDGSGVCDTQSEAIEEAKESWNEPWHFETELTELRKEREWISVDDELPEINQKFDAWIKGERQIDYVFRDVQGYENDAEIIRETCKIYGMTHWTPAIQPPANKDKDNG